MRVLLIDDQADSVQGLVEALREQGDLTEVCGFESVTEMLSDYRPDLVVLDIKAEGNERAGVGAYVDELWPDHFCPTVIYSAVADAIDEADLTDRPLLSKVQKGGDSEQEAVEALNALKPYAESIAATRHELDQQAAVTLRELVETVAAAGGLERAEQLELVGAMGRRRLAAYLDDPAQPTTQRPENQYVYPVVGEGLRFADVLRVAEGDSADPEAFRLVLTPSCDLVPRAGGPKATQVLLAKCTRVPLDKLQIATLASDKGKEKLGTLLNDGFHRNYAFLPGFLSVVPPLCVDFRQLQVVAYEDSGNGHGASGHVRIASVDSPFRERIAWAFMSTNCRPGVPQQDVERWIGMIAE